MSHGMYRARWVSYMEKCGCVSVDTPCTAHTVHVRRILQGGVWVSASTAAKEEEEEEEEYEPTFAELHPLVVSTVNQRTSH